MSTNEIDVAGIRARAEAVRVAADSAVVMAAITKDVNGVFKVVATAAARSAADVPALLAQLAERDRVIAAVRELANRGVGTDLNPTRLAGGADDGWWIDYLSRHDATWRSRLLQIAQEPTR